MKHIARVVLVKRRLFVNIIPIRNHSSMDVDAFPCFKDFLIRTRATAETDGYRFKTDLSYPTQEREFIGMFAKQVSSAPLGSSLRDELERAILICESEAIRKVMVITCKELAIWPKDRNLSDEKLSCESGIEQTAYALWMHEESLDQDPIIAERHKLLTMTAFFIVDFAHWAGVPEASEVSPGGKKLLEDFLSSARTYNPSLSDRLKSVLTDIVKVWAPPNIKKELKNWVDYNWDSVLVGGLAFAAGMFVAAMLAGLKRRR